MQVVVAHGRLKPEALEAAVLGFSEGRGAAFLITEPGRRLTGATRARLRTLEQLGSLHAGVAIATADMDQRGAGELFGEAQAGHVSALGTDLYHHLLLRAVEGGGAPALPEVHAGLAGCILEAMVPEADLRLALYRRLSRLRTAADVEAFAEELEDRFGAADAGLGALLMVARLRCAGVALGVAQMDVGPRGAALTLRDVEVAKKVAAQLGGTVKEGRVLVAVEGRDAASRGASLLRLLLS